MAEDNQKELTPEEMREEMRKSRMQDLENEFYLGLVGANALKRSPELYGKIATEIGNSLYSQFMTGDDAEKLRKKMSKQEMRERDVLGIADMPESPSNYAVMKFGISAVHNAVAGLPLGNLENIVRKVAPEVKLEIPEQLRLYSGNEEKLSEEIRADVNKYKNLVLTAVTESAAYKLIDAHRYDGLNATAEELGKKYNPKERVLEVRE
ncbi:MAG: hypothetical protein ABIH49_00740 [archaeon]